MTRPGDAESVCIVPRDKYIRPALEGPKSHTAILQYAFHDSEDKGISTLLSESGGYIESSAPRVLMRQRMVHV